MALVVLRVSEVSSTSDGSTAASLPGSVDDPAEDLNKDITQGLEGDIDRAIPVVLPSGNRLDISAFRKNLIACFSNSELRTLCFTLNIYYEDLPGETRADKARELILYAQRHECIEELLTHCCEERPRVDWRKTVAVPIFPLTDRNVEGDTPVSWNHIPRMIAQICTKVEEAVAVKALDPTTAQKVKQKLEAVTFPIPKKAAPAIQAGLQTAYRLVLNQVEALQEAAAVEQALVVEESQDEPSREQRRSDARAFIAGAALLTVIAVDLLTTGGMITCLSLGFGAGHTLARQHDQAQTCLACGAAMTS